MDRSMRIAIADDHTLVRAGLKILLSTLPGVEVVGEASDGADAVELAERCKPDVMLMDIAMKRVNGLDLKIDRDCEDLFALFQPVASDLRFTLAMMHVSNNLERIGDIAASVAKFVLDADENFQMELLERTRIVEMYGIAKEMRADTLEAYEAEDTRLVRAICKRAKILDKIDQDSLDRVAECIKEHPDQVRNALLVLSMIRKLERIGDQTKNIAEEVIFYYEAKVLKHKKRKKKMQDPDD